MTEAGAGRDVESWDGLDPIYDTVGRDTGGRDEWIPTDVPDGALVDLGDADERIVQATIDALERPRKSEGIHQGHLPLLDLPGFGESYDDCGDDLAHFCTDCGHTTVFGRTCRQSTCPRCGAAWARERGKTVVGKLLALRAQLDTQRADHQRFHHLTLSPNMEWALEAQDPLDRTVKAIKEIKEIFDAFGLQGVWFYHPWRGRNADRELDDRGEWKRRLFQGRDWEGDVKEELKFHPHFHVLVVDHHVPGGDITKRVYQETGWVIHRIHRIHREDSAVSIPDDYALARAATYCLSHTGIDVVEDGHNQAACGYIGADLRQATILDRYEPEVNALVRRASVDTLGLANTGFDCLQERAADEVRVDVPPPGAGAADDRELDTTAGG